MQGITGLGCTVSGFTQVFFVAVAVVVIVIVNVNVIVIVVVVVLVVVLVIVVVAFVAILIFRNVCGDPGGCCGVGRTCVGASTPEP